MKQLTIAYIGNGKSTNRYHLPFALKLKDQIRVKTIYERSDRSTWEKIPGVTYTHDLEDIYSDPEIDLVVVTVPLPAHVTMAQDVLNHGKNLLLEKPFTTTAAEARELFDLANEKGLFLQCYTNRRYDSDFLTVQKVIEGGKLGELVELDNTFDYYRADVPETKDFTEANSFYYGHAVHTLDQMVSYFGQPEEARYDVRQLTRPTNMDDNFEVNLYYGHLKVNVASSFYRLIPRPSFTVVGKKGTFIKQGTDRQEEHLKMFYMPEHADFGVDRPQDYGTLTYLDDDGIFHEEKVVSEVGDYSRTYLDVYDTLVNGAPKKTTDEQTITVMTMIEDGYHQLVERNL